MKITDADAKNIACAITMQAVKDYFVTGVTAKKQQTILADLRSEWMKFITDGMSLIVAEQLELHPEEIRERVRRESEI